MKKVIICGLSFIIVKVQLTEIDHFKSRAKNKGEIDMYFVEG